MSTTTTYELLDEGKAIRCLYCGNTSRNWNDVEHRYCGRCKLFHLSNEHHQHWECSKCSAAGDVHAPPGIDPVTMFWCCHDAHRIESPTCFDQHGATYLALQQTAPLPD